MRALLAATALLVVAGVVVGVVLPACDDAEGSIAYYANQSPGDDGDMEIDPLASVAGSWRPRDLAPQVDLWHQDMTVLPDLTVADLAPCWFCAADAAHVDLRAGVADMVTPPDLGPNGSSGGNQQHVIPGGRVWAMGADLTLDNGDTLECGDGVTWATIQANGHRITATSLSGHVWLNKCHVLNCGGTGQSSEPNDACLNLSLTSSGDVIIERSQFDDTGAVYLTTGGASTATIDYNRISPTQKVYIQDEHTGSAYTPFFHFFGASTAAKYFRGNDLYSTGVTVEGANNWQIGGTQAGEGNNFLGHRGAIRFYGGDSDSLIGNYLRPAMLGSFDPDVEVVAFANTNTNFVARHNIIRNGEWGMRGGAGTVAYNIFTERYSHNFILTPAANTKIHHNLFLETIAVCNGEGLIGFNTAVDGIEIYNNTFDGYNFSQTELSGPVVYIPPGMAIQRFHSNVIARFRLDFSALSNRRIGATGSIAPGDARLLYGDYNDFYQVTANNYQSNPTTLSNYGNALSSVVRFEPSTLTVAHCAGSPSDCTSPTIYSERNDAVNQSAYHDLTSASGTINQMVAPSFKGPFPSLPGSIVNYCGLQASDPVPYAQPTFPFCEACVEQRASGCTVKAILEYYRAIYTPAGGSPLIDSGDTVNGGAGNDIGAIGAGTSNANDLFGTVLQ